jgi:hypothetical protein
MTSHEEAIERDWKTPYVLGDLPERERNRFEEHFFDCPTCSEGVRTAYLLLRGVEVTLKHPIFGTEMEEAPPVPRRKAVRPIRSWAMRVLPYAAMLVLALGAGAQYIALQKARSPQAVVAFHIHAQAKGSAPELLLPAAGFVELKIDVPELAPLYDWEIRSAGTGRALMNGQARPPADSVVFRILVPADKLHPGRYEADVIVPPDHHTAYPFNVIAEPERRGAP